MKTTSNANSLNGTKYKNVNIVDDFILADYFTNGKTLQEERK